MTGNLRANHRRRLAEVVHRPKGVSETGTPGLSVTVGQIPTVDFAAESRDSAVGSTDHMPVNRPASKN
jgi:hypothetical protein